MAPHPSSTASTSRPHRVPRVGARIHGGGDQQQSAAAPTAARCHRSYRAVLFSASGLLLSLLLLFDGFGGADSFAALSSVSRSNHHHHHPILHPACPNTNTNHHHYHPSTHLTMSSQPSDDAINTDEDPRLYRIRIPRAPGIEWGTDLSFSFVYVRSMEPSGPASLSGVQTGDQICELRSVPPPGEDDDGTAPAVPLIGSPFDAVMNAFASLGPKVGEVDLVFFRGTKEELVALCRSSGGESGGGGGGDPDTVTITVICEKGSPSERTVAIQAPIGANVRQVLVDSGINVYQSVTRWTNCEGKQLCGTCIVNVKEGHGNTNRKSMDEDSTLRENPDGYRLSCVTFAYGDVTVETFPPLNAAQWTR